MTERELAALLDESRPLSDDERAAVLAETDEPTVDPLASMLALLREHGAPTHAFGARTMSAVEARGRGPWRRAIDALLRPRALRFSLATAVPVVAAAAAGVSMLAQVEPARPERPAAATPVVALAARAPAGIPVRFELAAPDARRVAVAGDFNAWQPEAAALRDDDGDGIWTATVSLQPGRYAYKFVVNGQRWLLDPDADAVQPDDFGGQNSVLRL